MLQTDVMLDTNNIVEITQEGIETQVDEGAVDEVVAAGGEVASAGVEVVAAEGEVASTGVEDVTAEGEVASAVVEVVAKEDIEYAVVEDAAAEEEVSYAVVEDLAAEGESAVVEDVTAEEEFESAVAEGVAAQEDSDSAVAEGVAAQEDSDSAVAEGVAAEEEVESAQVAQECDGFVTKQPQLNEMEDKEVVDAFEAAENERVVTKSAETKRVELEDAVVECYAIQSKFNEEEALTACVKTDVTDEKTNVYAGSKEDPYADAAAQLKHSESTIAVADVNSEIKAAIDISDVIAAKEGALNADPVVLVTDEELANKRCLVKEAAVDVEANDIQAIALNEIIDAVAEEAVSAMIPSKSLEIEALDEAKAVTQGIPLPLQATVPNATIEEVAMEAVAILQTDDSAVMTKLEVSVKSNIDDKKVEVTIDESLLDDDEFEEANAMQEQEKDDEEDIEASNTKADTATKTTIDTPAKRIVETIMEEVEAEKSVVVETDKRIDEDAEAVGIEASTEAVPLDIDNNMVKYETDTALFGERTKFVVPENETKTAAFSLEIDEAVVKETNAEIASVAEVNEVQLKESGHIEVLAVDKKFATEEVQKTDWAVAKVREEARDDVALIKANDDEPSIVEQTSAVEVGQADAKPDEANLTALNASDCEDSSKSCDKFEVDTKPIIAVSTLIGRFEQIAKHNATKAASSRSSSRTSSRYTSPLPSPPASWSRGNIFETVAKSNEESERLEGPLGVDLDEEDVLTEDKKDQEEVEVEITVTSTESVYESSQFEEAPAEDDVLEEASTLNETDTIALEKTPAVADIAVAAKESSVVEIPAVKTDEDKSEAAIEQSDAIEEAPIVEVKSVEQVSVDESTEPEVEVEKDLFVELQKAESIAEPEAEDVDFEIIIEEEIVETAEGADAPASEAVEAYDAVEEVPVAVVPVVDTAETDADKSETRAVVPAPSILSVDGSKVDAVRKEAITEDEEIVEDAALTAKSLVDVEEAVAMVDSTTDKAIDSSCLVTDQDDSNEYASTRKEALMTETSLKATVEMTLTSPVTKAENNDTEITPEYDSFEPIPFEQLTYEILGVTRVNNVAMYHIYTINRATGEQAMSIPKRYSEFKLLEERLQALDLPSTPGLPILPKPTVSSFFRGRRCKKTIEMREKAFGDLLHYIRDHEDLHRSIIFQQFIGN
ncbi:unnamed protein product [Peronospora belbahrii]|uniref:PX domain-containing protein n=1 Tax=Peronospora belbahrii TaxID=622444 RepID=A0ABN8DBJ1_9STRA|nr:unnamed protein product [Peronospora belbahrii]